MRSEPLVNLALTLLGCTQKELAARMGVSTSQISKWKKGEYMSHDMEEKLAHIAGIGDSDPEFVLMAGSLEDAAKWERLLRYLADSAVFGAETGYHTYRLEEDEEADLLHWSTFDTLREMGVEIPKPFPAELDFDYEQAGVSDDEADARIDALFENPYVSLISAIYKSYVDVYGFYAAYVGHLIDELELYDEPACNIEPCLLSLAAAKLDEPPALAHNFNKFRYKTNKDYTEWLSFLKDKAFQAGMPLRAELLDLVNHSHDSLGHDAEAESLGFNESRLHPDIYMNELLVGMRVIHQVLPAILKKLGIEDDFQLDSSELSLR